MNGPAHYLSAEELCHRSAISAVRADLSPEERARLQDAELRGAMVHAVLALAAAVGMSASMPNPDAADWRNAAGVRFGKEDERRSP